jgi:hypothetical protein
VAIARQKLEGKKFSNCNNITFDVIQLSDAMGWQSGLVKRELKALQWSVSAERGQYQIPFQLFFFKRCYLLSSKLTLRGCFQLCLCFCRVVMCPLFFYSKISVAHFKTYTRARTRAHTHTHIRTHTHTHMHAHTHTHAGRERERDSLEVDDLRRWSEQYFAVKSSSGGSKEVDL